MWDIIFLRALFGTSIPISKVLLKFTNPVFLTGIRMTIAGFIMLTYQYFFAHKKFKIKWEHIFYYFQIIFWGVYIKNILRFWGLSYISAAKMSFLQTTPPFFSALFSYLAFGEKYTLKQWAGLIISFAALLPILITTSAAEQLIGEIFIFSWPELAVIAAMAGYSYNLIVMRKLVRENHYSPPMVNGIATFFGGGLALLTAFFVLGFQPIENPVTFTGLLFTTIFISNIICHNFYVYLVKFYSTTFLTFTGFLTPIFVSFYGWLFLGETIGWQYFVSGSIIFFGLFLFYQDELQSIIKNKKTHKEIS